MMVHYWMGKAMISYWMGNCGAWSQTMAVLKNGALISPKSLAREYKPERGCKVKVNIGGVDVIIEKISTSRYVSVIARVPAEHVLALVKEEATPRLWKGLTILDGPGEIICNLVQEEKIINDIKFVDLYEVYYYVHEPVKVLLKKRLVRRV